MVGGTPKPFACTNEGCSMTFTNEDHLNVHQKKHEMDLNLSLGNKSNIFVADQTPTPTRFLRNCEEVGLFQDLQNVNPFEETFRRAIEQVKTGSLPEPDLAADDTLHTPHVFPLVPEESGMYSTQNCRELKISNEKISLTRHIDLTIVDVHDLTKECNENKEVLTIPDKTFALETHNISNSPDHDYALETNRNKNVANITSPSRKVMELISPENKGCNNKVENSSLPTKLKLKQILLQNRKEYMTIGQIDKNSLQPVYVTKVITSKPPVSTVNNFLPTFNTTTLKLPSMTTQATINLTENSQKNLKSKSVQHVIKNNKIGANNRVQSVDIKKDEMKIRNRAAALRCRQKRKIWIKNLESKYDIVCKSNQNLQKDVTNLKTEVLQLKTLLLAHKDCSVTKAMNMGQITIEPTQIISVQMCTKGDIVNKLRTVLPKENLTDDSTYDRKKNCLDPMKDISYVTTQSKKSVIVLNTAYNELFN